MVDNLAVIQSWDDEESSGLILNSVNSDNALERAKAGFDLLSLIRRDTGEDGRRSGDRYDFEECPVCGHSNCFRYHANTNTWCCHSASNNTGHAGGSVIDYLIAVHGYELSDAIKLVLEATGYSYDVQQSDTVSYDSSNARTVNVSLRPDNHVACARFLLEYYFMCYIDGAPAVWTGLHYETGQNAVERILTTIPGIKRSQRAEVLSYLELNAPRYKAADPRYIAFENCVLDISDMSQLVPSSDLRITNVIPHDWNPEAQCAEVDEALIAWACGNDNRIRAMKECVGLCMYRGTEFGVCFVLVGEGSNGKSTFIDGLLRPAIGDNNISSTELSTIGKRYQSVSVMGKLANICDDTSSEPLKRDDSATIKKLVTGNMISAEYKYGPTFDFKPYATLVFSCNEMPRFDKAGKAEMRRLNIIRFGADFSHKNSSTDINYLKKLGSEEAMERILYLGALALHDCIERGSVTLSQDNKESKEQMRMDSSGVYQFAVEELGFKSKQPVSVDGVPTQDLFEKYTGYCTKANLKAVSRNSFTIEMCEIMSLETKKMRLDGRGQLSCFVEKQN